MLMRLGNLHLWTVLFALSVFAPASAYAQVAPNTCGQLYSYCASEDVGYFGVCMEYIDTVWVNSTAPICGPKNVKKGNLLILYQRWVYAHWDEAGSLLAWDCLERALEEAYPCKKGRR